jgi:hypothetical protein
MSGLVTALIVSGSSRADSRANLVRVASPTDLVLQPTDADTGMVKLDFEFDRAVSYMMLTTNKPPPFKLPATAKTLSWGPCGAAGGLLPGGKVTLKYDAFDSAGAKIGSGSWDFTVGPDSTKPTARIVSPKDNSLVRRGEVVDIVVVGEESKSARTWQTGIRRLTLVDPALNVQYSAETPPSVCESMQWTQQHHFRYVVPPDAPSGQRLTLKAAVEDGAKNISFASLDLIVQQGFAGRWTTKGRFTGPQKTEFTYAIEAVFSFTLSPSGVVECGTASRPFCGSAKITFDPGQSKGCVVTRTPASSIFKISAGGVRKANELTRLTYQAREAIPVGYHFDCSSRLFDTAGYVDMPVGSMWQDGITIALPRSDHTTATKHESMVLKGGNADVDHRVEIYAPRQNR